ncbi:unnamed protein product [Trichogramma brassicae]|uniref:Uncharacterized protein n=1 Tax=Trichogramma brassicae TaxID=86971 RepID=A0A6H5IA03_9HYME|nr:unnamed protein product [Trichogramma brassicae]
MWQAAHLYRINHGILAVACVEHVLCPGKGDEEYKMIYGGDYQKATELYKKLCDIPEEDQLDLAIVKSAASFFQCTDKCLESIRSYLREINIDYEEIEHIKKASIELIKSNKDKLSTNMMDPIEYLTINAPIDDEQPHPNMIQIINPDIPLEHVDPPSVSIPVDHGLIISNEDELCTNMIDSIEYHTINVPIDGEQPNSNMYQIIYPDMPSSNVDPPSLVSIPVDQALITSNEDELCTNMIDLIEYHTINVTTADEVTLPPMPDMPLEHVDPPSVSIPVDQALIKSNKDKLSTLVMDLMEDHPINVTTDDEETLPPMPDIPLEHVDPPSVSIPVDQALIKSNKDKLSTLVMDLTEDHPINMTTNDEETLPPMPDIPLEHVDPPSVSIPVDQGSIKSNEDKLSTDMLDPIEDHPINVSIDDEQSRSPPTDVPTVKVYLPSTSMIDLDEYHPIILINDDENVSSPTPNVSSPGPNVSKVNLFSKVSIPVNQGLILNFKTRKTTIAAAAAAAASLIIGKFKCPSAYNLCPRRHCIHDARGDSCDFFIHMVFALVQVCDVRDEFKK